jgi:hypothetical protein
MHNLSTGYAQENSLFSPQIARVIHMGGNAILSINTKTSEKCLRIDLNRYILFGYKYQSFYIK